MGQMQWAGNQALCTPGSAPPDLGSAASIVPAVLFLLPFAQPCTAWIRALAGRVRADPESLARA